MEDVELTFRRFSEDKQEQIRQLVSYCSLMGLTGKDLVSIGGKLDRINKQKERDSNLEIGLSYHCIPVGRSAKEQARNSNRKWYYTDGNGVQWKFSRDPIGYGGVDVTNCSSGKQRTFYCNALVRKPGSNARANVMANLHHGLITLNF